MGTKRQTSVPFQFFPGKRRTHIKKFRTVSQKPKSLGRAAGLSVLALCAALCLLAFPALSPPAALEASAFNGGREFGAAAVAAEPIRDPPHTVVPLGSAFGIKLFTDGIIVASLSDIYTDQGLCCPAADAGIRTGDYLLTADGVPVEKNAALAHLIGGSDGSPIAFTVRRGGTVFETEVTPAFSEGSFKTGMWIRDSAAGIGTLTFYDPATGLFAGLGHGICDMDTAGVMSLKTGEPAPITLCGIDRGVPYVPGQLKGYFSSEESMGRLLKNSDTGVYGSLTAAPEGAPVEVLPREQVKRGPVKLLAAVDETGPQYYDAEILRVSAGNQHTRNLIVKITDPRLLERTGGIVQGMSGSPILQDGKLAGAVTHVFTDDPTCGYGIFAQTMCEEIVTCLPTAG